MKEIGIQPTLNTSHILCSLDKVHLKYIINLVQTNLIEVWQTLCVKHATWIRMFNPHHDIMTNVLLLFHITDKAHKLNQFPKITLEPNAGISLKLGLSDSKAYCVIHHLNYFLFWMAHQKERLMSIKIRSKWSRVSIVEKKGKFNMLIGEWIFEDILKKQIWNNISYETRICLKMFIYHYNA